MLQSINRGYPNSRGRVPNPRIYSHRPDEPARVFEQRQFTGGLHDWTQPVISVKTRFTCLAIDGGHGNIERLSSCCKMHLKSSISVGQFQQVFQKALHAFSDHSGLIGMEEAMAI